MYNRLFFCKEEHNGLTNVTLRSEYGSLAQWTKTQLASYSRGNLSIVRIAILELGGFQWKLNMHDNASMKMYQRLMKYNQKYGNTRVPYQFKKDTQLGNWVENLR